MLHRAESNGTVRNRTLVFTESSRNLHGIFTESSRNLHGIFTESSRNLHGVFTFRAPLAAAGYDRKMVIFNNIYGMTWISAAYYTGRNDSGAKNFGVFPKSVL